MSETYREEGPGDATGASHLPEAPSLTLALNCHDLTLRPMKFSLHGLERVEVGRGDSTEFTVHQGSGSLKLGDPRASSRHAVFERHGDRWEFRDLGSTNGSRVNGKPVTEPLSLNDGALVSIGRTLFALRTLDRLDPLHTRPREPGFDTLDAHYRLALHRLERIAASEIPVVLAGETGSGKEVLAQAIHRASARRGRFVALNCGALPSGLNESLLFGHKRGAFTGAAADETGFVRSAHNGTLFLDEIADLPLESQAALLRVLQEGEVVPVGTTEPVRVDIRLISATHQPLEKLVDAGRFRRDLYARLAGFVHSVPPLRERRQDIALLTTVLCEKLLDRPLRFSVEAAEALLSYAWPLNVRELEQCLRTAFVLVSKDQVELRHLPPSLQEQPTPDSRPPGTHTGDAPEGLSEADIDLRVRLVALLEAEGGNVSAVARRMGKARQQVQKWIKRLGIERPGSDTQSH